MLRRFSLAYTLFIRVLDTAIVILALILASELRIRINAGLMGDTEVFANPPWLYVVACALWLLAFQFTGVYLPINISWLWREIQRLLLGHGLASLLFFGVLYLVYRDYSRLQSFYVILLVLVGTLGYRIIVRAVLKLTGRSVSSSIGILVVGTDHNAQRIGKAVSAYSWAGLTLRGFVQHHAGDEIIEELNGPILGTADDLPLLVARHKASEVIISLKTPDPEYVSRVIDSLRNFVTNIRLAPDYSDLAYFHVSVEAFSGIPLLGLREAVLSPSQRFFKRLFDIVIAGALAVVVLPVFVAIAIAIKLESPGPIIFKQKRIGEHGRPFFMLKFRSMVANAEKLQNKANVNHKQQGDPRITRVGHFLRRTSLDELPQFLNILRGDMSLVGPRPEMPWLVEKYEPWQRKRFEVPQGLTGWWQISGRADKPMYLNTEDDLFYIRNYSLWLDLQIIFRTVLIVFLGRGAF